MVCATEFCSPLLGWFPDNVEKRQHVGRDLETREKKMLVTPNKQRGKDFSENFLSPRKDGPGGNV